MFYHACIGDWRNLTTVLTETLMADFAQTLEALVQIPHLVLQVCVLLVEDVVLHLALQG